MEYSAAPGEFSKTLQLSSYGDSDKKLSICVVSTGSRGDVQPYCALAQAFHSAGHQVSLASEGRHEKLVTQEFKLDFKRIHGDSLGGFGDPKHAKGLEEGSLWTLMAIANEAKAGYDINDILASYVEALSGYDIIITGGLCLNQSYCVAEKTGAVWIPMILGPTMPTSEFPIWPLAFLACCACMNRWTYTKMFATLWDEEKTFINPWRKSVLGLPPIDTPLGVMNVIEEKRIPVLIACSTKICGPRQEIPADYDQTYVHVCGFPFVELTPEDGIDDRLRQFINTDPVPYGDQNRPVIYLGFGSMPVTDPFRIVKIAIEICENARCRAVIIAGWSGLSETDCADVLTKYADTILVTDSAPHDYVFPRMDCIIHHCGIGTTAAAMRSGRPQIPCPVMLDQPHNAKMLVALGVANEFIPFSSITAQKVTYAVKRVLTNEGGVHEAAQKVGEFVRNESARTFDKCVAVTIEYYHEVTAKSQLKDVKSSASLLVI